ncbi:MAG TPA: restriction endonuclease subunit S [Ginsengibacter sp.]|mgnify:CR=1 FL=1|nr:restriction endonuclease subunit S [Chitinophagaceae bacterium]HRP16523.1 restriction endonuclease subunit S [Ginsengibacter sp.]HRP43597.1 restriction endonuclease subunit S [Ginsengibacter sp.]
MTVTATNSKFKKTGLDWMPEVPEHWGVVRLKNFSSLKARIGFHGLNSTDFIDEGPYCITGTDFANGVIDFTTCYHVSVYWYNMDSNIQIQNGDILVTKDGTIGKVAIVKNLNQKATLNSGVFVLRVFSKLDTEYFFWLLHSQCFKIQIELIKRGTTINHLYERDFRNFLFPVPPLTEQAAIVQYIQAKEEKINRFIEKKQRLIELLKEQRQGVIDEVVSGKRLVVSDELLVVSDERLVKPQKTKPSGVDWLGDIPEHWEMRRLKNCGSFQSGENITSQEIENTGEFPVYGGNGLRGYYNHFTHEGDYVLIGRQGALCGNINYAHGRFWATEHAVVVTLKPNIDYFWFGETLRVMNLNQYSQSAAQPGIAIENIRRLHLPFPPLEEQKQIVSYIKTETATIDTAIDKAEREIELIREYKEAMISEAVMGKRMIVNY